MSLKDLIPWRKVKREEASLPAGRGDRGRDLFEDFFRRWGFDTPSPWTGELFRFNPTVDVAETDQEFQVKVELPGLSKDDVNVSLKQGYLTIRGEKHEEQREEKKDYLRTECSYGSFTRTLQVPDVVDEEAVDASFKNGVLNIRLPKESRAQGKVVEVKGG